MQKLLQPVKMQVLLCFKEVNKMVKIDVFSGFLGAGKTTLIKKLISEAFVGEKVVLIENEFGEIGIDFNPVLSTF